MAYRYAVLRSLCDGTPTQLNECEDLQTAKVLTEHCARREQGYFYVVDRETKRVVYVYSLNATKDAKDQETPAS